ncbi:MAG: hypothetical protein QOH65_26 [Methylobacteriaceae bacterium]|jgi:hypothetical protein|nr:hypothetical protein [Methylobacteriaceae bacterium]
MRGGAKRFTMLAIWNAPSPVATPSPARGEGRAQRIAQRLQLAVGRVEAALLSDGIPQMSLGLDEEEEATQLRFAFEEEIKRLNAA